MDTESWEGKDPAPLEFFHSEIMNEFHDYRKSFRNEKGIPLQVPMSGVYLTDIIAKAKTRTHEKYPHLDLISAVPKPE